MGHLQLCFDFGHCAENRQIASRVAVGILADFLPDHVAFHGALVRSEW